MAKALTPKQEKFYLAYKESGDQVEAYKVAYDTSKMKPAHITKEANKLLKHPLIAPLILSHKRKIEEKTDVTLIKVVNEISKLAFFDIRKLYDEDGRMLQPHELSDEAAAAVSGFKTRTESTGRGEDREIALIEEYKTYDKSKNLDMLMKHLGAYIEKHEHTGRNGGPIENKWVVEFVEPDE